MLRTTTLLTILLIGAAFAGCADTGDGDGTGAPTPTPTPPATPTPATPTSATPVVPTSPTPAANLTGNVTSPGIYVTSIPAMLTAGEPATVCWHVNGTARIPHTALHFDTESHPDSTRFQDYDQGAVYPGNASAADPAGYAVPGDFCANLTVPETGTLYFRAHALIPNVRNELSEEHSLSASGGGA